METRTIEQERIIGAKPVQVYDAWVNPKKHAEFTGAAATGKAEIGGEFSAWDGYITGTYVELIRARKIVQQWKTTEWPQGYPPSRLEVTFVEHAEGTEVKLTHSEVPASQVEAYRQGWVDYYWEPLREYFAHKP